jgi:hypothetical protein
MNRVARGALGIAVALAAFYGVKTLKQEALGREPTSAELTKQLDDLRERAEREHPDMSKTDAFKQLASEHTAKKLASQTADQQANTAADIFWGFYYMNTKVRTQYCAQRGIDLSPFVAAFTKEHSDAFAKASAVYALAGLSTEKYLPIIMEASAKGVEQDMKDVTTGAQVPLDQACSLFNENAKYFAENIQLPPQVKQTLLSYK